MPSDMRDAPSSSPSSRPWGAPSHHLLGGLVRELAVCELGPACERRACAVSVGLPAGTDEERAPPHVASCATPTCPYSHA